MPERKVNKKQTGAVTSLCKSGQLSIIPWREVADDYFGKDILNVRAGVSVSQKSWHMAMILREVLFF